ncbi:hypothetical protein P886_3412 [Alteromonadaceae bacterium 2753L.S.0a.02]|nr:hypothetical protein P886_3412 [Alteromonadaceae bacterium 2753L.S.0a.02]
MKYLISLIILFSSVEAIAENTPYKTIDRVQFNADSGAYFAYSSTGWEVCNNTKYVQLRGSSTNINMFTSQVLAAHMAQKTVQFSGECTNANGYFDSTYIKINK